METLKKINSEKLKRFVFGAETAATALIVASMPTIYAFADTASAYDMVGQIVATVADVFMLIGVVLFAWAIGQLIMAFRDENADSKSRAMMLIVSSILMISMKTIISAFMDSAGTDVTISDESLLQ